jgi:hypothetical protein
MREDLADAGPGVAALDCCEEALSLVVMLLCFSAGADFGRVGLAAVATALTALRDFGR